MALSDAELQPDWHRIIPAKSSSQAAALIEQVRRR